MNREAIKKHKAVFDAWLDGVEIEYKHQGEGEWEAVANPAWYTGNDFRIKPQPQTRTMWVTIFSGGGGENYYLHDTITDAKKMDKFHQIACVPVEVTWTEGEGL